MDPEMMNEPEKIDLLAAVGDVDEELIASSAELYNESKPKIGNTLLRFATACACVLLIVGLLPMSFWLFGKHRDPDALSGYALLYYYRSDALGDFAGSYIATESIDVSQSRNRRTLHRTEEKENFDGMVEVNETAPEQLLEYLGSGYKVYACENGTRLYVSASGEMYIDLGIAGVFRLEKND